jgi:hypothetical protein
MEATDKIGGVALIAESSAHSPLGGDEAVFADARLEFGFAFIRVH